MKLVRIEYSFNRANEVSTYTYVKMPNGSSLCFTKDELMEAVKGMDRDEQITLLKDYADALMKVDVLRRAQLSEFSSHLKSLNPKCTGNIESDLRSMALSVDIFKAITASMHHDQDYRNLIRQRMYTLVTTAMYYVNNIPNMDLPESIQIFNASIAESISEETFYEAFRDAFAIVTVVSARRRNLHSNNVNDSQVYSDIVPDMDWIRNEADWIRNEARKAMVNGGGQDREDLDQLRTHAFVSNLNHIAHHQHTDKE